LFERYRAEIADRRVPPSRVIEPLDPHLQMLMMQRHGLRLSEAVGLRRVPQHVWMHSAIVRATPRKAESPLSSLNLDAGQRLHPRLFRP
jgi:hypothetical protein